MNILGKISTMKNHGTMKLQNQETIELQNQNRGTGSAEPENQGTSNHGELQNQDMEN